MGMWHPRAYIAHKADCNFIYIYVYIYLLQYICLLYLYILGKQAECAISFHRTFVHPAVTCSVLPDGHHCCLLLPSGHGQCLSWRREQPDGFPSVGLVSGRGAVGLRDAWRSEEEVND